MRKFRPAKAIAWGCSVLWASASVHATGMTVRNLAHSYPFEHTTAIAPSLFSDLLGSRSTEHLQVKVYEDVADGKQSPIFQSLHNGTLDVFVPSLGVITTVVPETAAFGLSFLFC